MSLHYDPFNNQILKIHEDIFQVSTIYCKVVEHAQSFSFILQFSSHLKLWLILSMDQCDFYTYLVSKLYLLTAARSQKKTLFLAETIHKDSTIKI